MPSKRPAAKRRWFLRPLWRDPSFLFCFVFSVVAYAAMLPFLWSKATNLFFQFLVVCYFFLIWFLVCALMSIPIGVIRGFWQGKAEADARARDPEHKPTSSQAALRVTGRMVGRYAAKRKRPDS